MFGIYTIARYSFEKRRNHLRCQQNYSTNIVSGNERCQYTPVETRNFSQARDNLPAVTFKRSSRLSIQQLLREQSDSFVYSPARAEGPLLLASKTVKLRQRIRLIFSGTSRSISAASIGPSMEVPFIDPTSSFLQLTTSSKKRYLQQL